MGRRYSSEDAAMVFVVISLALLWSVRGITATMEEDEKECADQLQNLASCIPYVSGSAKKPTQQCCDDTVKVRSQKPKCLCVLIKESADPSLALPVNTTLAIQMPAACNIDAKVSDCPAILKLPPDSPDAKIFKEANTGSTTEMSSPPSTSASSTTTGSSPSTTTTSSDSKAVPNSSEGMILKFSGSGWVFVMLVGITWMLV